MFNSQQEQRTKQEDKMPECLKGFSYIPENQEDFAHLRGEWVEIISPFPVVAYGRYRGLTSVGTDVFYPSVVHEPYILGAERRVALVWENNSPIAIPHSPGMVLVPRTLEHISTRVAEDSRITIPCEKDIRGVLREDSKMKRLIERNDSRAKRKMRDIAG